MNIKIGDTLECKNTYSFITDWRVEDCILPGDRGTITEIRGNWYILKLDRRTILGTTDIGLLDSKIGLYFVNTDEQENNGKSKLLSI